MNRSVTFRPTAVAAGLAAAVGVALTAGVLLADPGAATVRSLTAAATTAAPTAQLTPATSTSGPAPSGTTTTGTPCYTYTPPTLGPGGIAAGWTFEDGTLGNWSSSPGVGLANTTEASSGGTHSLKVLRLTSDTNVGASTGDLTSFGWYSVTARVRLAAGSAPAYLSLAPQTTSYATPSSMTGYVRATADGWADVTSYFRPGTTYADWYCNGAMTGTEYPSATRVQFSLALLACADATSGPRDLYLDDVVVTSLAAGNGGTPNPTATGPVPTPPPSPLCIPPSSPPTTTTSPPVARCTARYTVGSQWQSGYLADLTVRNLTTDTLTGWVLTATFPGDPGVLSLWGAGSWIRAGNGVTVTAPPWNPSLPPGGSVSIGFVGSGAPQPPVSVTLDGASCTVITTA
jgi:Cellulose binding domain